MAWPCGLVCDCSLESFWKIVKSNFSICSSSLCRTGAVLIYVFGIVSFEATFCPDFGWRVAADERFVSRLCLGLEPEAFVATCV